MKVWKSIELCLNCSEGFALKKRFGIFLVIIREYIINYCLQIGGGGWEMVRT